MIIEGFHYIECHCFYPLPYVLSLEDQGDLLAHVLESTRDHDLPFRKACPQCLCPYPKRHGELISFCLVTPTYCTKYTPPPPEPPFYNPKKHRYNQP